MLNTKTDVYIKNTYCYKLPRKVFTTSIFKRTTRLKLVRKSVRANEEDFEAEKFKLRKLQEWFTFILKI